jgi:hypothetical protein
MDEYNVKYHKYDKFREELKNKESEETLRIQVKKLEAKIKNIERSHVIEMRYSKEKARERADQILTDKLSKMRAVFEKEVDHLRKQYYEIKD